MTSTEMGLLELLPLVTDGQPVNVGDTVSVITSNQVTNDIAGAMAELERLRRQLTLLKAPPKNEAIAQAQAQIAAARTNYDRLMRDFNRATEMREKNLNSPEDLESVQAEVDVASAELRDKQANLSLLQSPPRPEEEAVIDAEIDRQQAKLDFLISQKDAQHIVSPIAGKTVTGPAGENVLSVINEQVVEVLVPVSDFDIKHVQPGQRVRLKVRSYPADIFEGMVVHLPQQAVRQSEQLRFPVSVVLDNADNRLHKGMTGYAKIEIAKSSLFNMIRRKVYSVMRVEFWSWW
jgi:multidrug resistance efflux pump